jgi:hypothetical protein
MPVGPPRAQRGGDVGERGRRVVEEHHAEAAERHVKPGRGEGTDLRVCLLEAGVTHAVPAGAVARHGEHWP